MEKYARIENLFSDLEAQKQICSRCPAGVPSCTSSFPDSALSKLHFLIDENMRPSALKTLSENGFPLSTVQCFMPKGTPDEEVFAYAVKHDMPIVTRDRGFADFNHYDHTRSRGILILPDTLGDRFGRRLVEAEMGHFIREFALPMSCVRGLVVRYDGDGWVEAYKTVPSQPGKSRRIAKEKCAFG
ncbi:MAG: DUF5615 family PIN-like protein [Alphaproteobacteria bacterium]|nr:DUF5615 family PIN-like protein [Alphaproteobacteria bacterium]